MTVESFPVDLIFCASYLCQSTRQ